MKKILYSLLITSLLVSALTMSACGRKPTEKPLPHTATIDSAVDIEKLQSDYTTLESKYNDVTKIYDDTLEKSINTYCEKYLSYNGSAVDNIKNIKDVVTDTYYSELMSQTGHQKSLDNYEQSTGIVKLYYSNYSSPSDSIEILALCKQTVIYNNEVNTSNAVYTFDMMYKNNRWLINETKTV